MIKEYRKIKNIFKFDEKFKSICGINEPFNSLKNMTWVGTEKVDGTNIRIHWDGHSITILGRTENAQFQGNLYDYLCDIFQNEEMEYLFEQVFFDKEATIFGEGYGPKIQAGGGLYSDVPKFIVFDIDINGYHLNRENVVDIARSLSLDVVPVVFEGNLEDAIEYVSKHQNSKISSAHEMEGIVLELPLDIYDKDGERIKCKCKYRDILKSKENK